jgi:type I site-specific restriction-modification system R (restriction) subunit
MSSSTKMGKSTSRGRPKSSYGPTVFSPRSCPTPADWEKLSIFLNFLVPKLPAPKEEDLSKGILEAIDMDSYRVEKKAAAKIQLPDQDAEIAPVPTSGGGGKPEPELDRLSNILKTFNDQFGNIPGADSDRVHKLITEEIPEELPLILPIKTRRRIRTSKMHALNTIT